MIAGSLLSYEVAVISDWDVDGIVSAAEIVYAQEFLGVYPIKRRCRVRLLPASAHTFSQAVHEISGDSYDVVVVLDIPYTRNLIRGLKILRRISKSIVYVDHHISTMIHMDKLENMVDELIVTRAPTALTVAHMLRSIGARLSPRLEVFMRAASTIERGAKSSLPSTQRNILKLVVAISQTLSQTKDRTLWERLVRWLSSPISFTAMPFSQSLESIVGGKDRKAHMDEVKALANELAIEALKVYNLRLVDVRRKKLSNVKLTTLASALHRIFRAPVALIGYSKRSGTPLLILRSRDDLPYRLALKLWKDGIVSEVGGHQSIAICVLKQDYSVAELASVLRRALVSV